MENLSQISSEILIGAIMTLIYMEPDLSLEDIKNFADLLKDTRSELPEARDKDYAMLDSSLDETIGNFF